MLTAFECLGRKPDLPQPAFDARHVPSLAVVRCAGERDLLFAQVVVCRCSGFYQRQCLDGFDCGTRKYRIVYFAPNGYQVTSRIDNRSRASMYTFDIVAANDLDENRIRRFSHGLVPAAQTVAIVNADSAEKHMPSRAAITMLCAVMTEVLGLSGEA